MEYSTKGIFLGFILCVLIFLCLCFRLSGVGWRAAIRPADHPVANFEFDVVVGADGRRNTLEGEKTANKRGEQYRCLKDVLHFVHIDIMLPVQPDQGNDNL